MALKTAVGKYRTNVVIVINHIRHRGFLRLGIRAARVGENANQ
jgi:hypothetical protein